MIEVVELLPKGSAKVVELVRPSTGSTAETSANIQSRLGHQTRAQLQTQSTQQHVTVDDEQPAGNMHILINE